LLLQVMKDPVVAESEMTYEREAIQQWFDACQEQGREPMCPVSGQIVKTTKLRPNLVLQKTIQEWTRRNVVIRMRVATTQLSAASSVRFLAQLMVLHNFCTYCQGKTVANVSPVSQKPSFVIWPLKLCKLPAQV
jgi:hypothetical protein